MLSIFLFLRLKLLEANESTKQVLDAFTVNGFKETKPFATYLVSARSAKGFVL